MPSFALAPTAISTNGLIWPPRQSSDGNLKDNMDSEQRTWQVKCGWLGQELSRSHHILHPVLIKSDPRSPWQKATPIQVNLSIYHMDVPYFVSHFLGLIAIWVGYGNFHDVELTVSRPSWSSHINVIRSGFEACLMHGIICYFLPWW